MQYSRKQNKLCLAIKEDGNQRWKLEDGTKGDICGEKKRERKNTEIRGTDCVALIVIIVVVVHAERKRS